MVTKNSISDNPCQQDLFAKYPYVGTCNYIDGKPFAHVCSAYGRFMAPRDTRLPRCDESNPNGLSVCFNVGISLRDPNRRQELRAVRWITNNNIEGGTDGYEQNRVAWLGRLPIPELLEVITAKWYLEDNPAREREAVLRYDESLAKEAAKRLDETNDSKTYCKLWIACACSPYFAEKTQGKGFLQERIINLESSSDSLRADFSKKLLASSKNDARELCVRVHLEVILKKLTSHVPPDLSVWLRNVREVLADSKWGCSVSSQEKLLNGALRSLDKKPTSEFLSTDCNGFETFICEIENTSYVTSFQRKYMEAFVDTVPASDWSLRWTRFCKCTSGDPLKSGKNRNLWLDNQLREMSFAQTVDVLRYGVSKAQHFLAAIPEKNREMFSGHVKCVFDHNAIAVDLETDGVTLHEMGTAARGQESEVLKFPIESQNDVTSAIAGLASKADGKWLVGHNLIEWDLPVLGKLCADRDRQQFDAQSRSVWDTMLASMVLEPWKATHALLGATHRANVDAEAALKLFCEQVAWIKDDLSPLALAEAPVPFERWMDFLMFVEYSAPTPGAPPFLKDIAEHTHVIVPSAYLSALSWVPNIGYAFPPGHINSSDYFVPAAKVKLWMEHHQEEKESHLTLLTLLVRAERASIRLRAGSIPFWLQKKCRPCINHVAEPFSDKPDTCRWVVSSYESYYDVGKKPPLECDKVKWIAPQMDNLMGAGTVDITTSEAVQLAAELDITLPNNNREYALIECGKNKDSVPVWLEWHPARARWRKWQAIPFNREIQPYSFDGQFRFVRPNWIDPISGECVGIDSLWPITANRYVYWSDTILRVLSLLENRPAKGYLLLFIAEKTAEFELVEEVLLGLDKTWPSSTSSGEILRKAVERSSCVLVAPSDIPKWRSLLAENSQLTFDFVVEALPVEFWVTCCREKDEPDEDLDNNEECENVSDESAYSVESQGEETQFQDATSDRASKQQNGTCQILEGEVDRAIAIYLGVWLQTQFGTVEPIILDSRLNVVHSSHITHIGRQKEFNLLANAKVQEACKASFTFWASGCLLPEAEKLYADYRAFLFNHWGFKDFRKSQIDAVRAISERHHVLVRLPTGEGKSVIFQVPALVNAGHNGKLTVVITPLRALMKDQVDSLLKRGIGLINVAYLSGDCDPWLTAEVYQHILDGSIQLLFVAPERFRVGRFRDVLQRRVMLDNGLGFAVVDEAHCISQWGYEFRPDYLFAVNEMCKNFLQPPSTTQLLLLSATVTKHTQQHLERLTGMSGSGPDKTLVSLPKELTFPIKGHLTISDPAKAEVGLYGRDWEQNIEFRIPLLADTIRKSDPDLSTVLIFVTRRTHAEHLRDRLRQEKSLGAKYRIEAFHAGMPSDDRQRILASLDPRQNALDSRTNVLIATKAFGMGMDIPNIHWAIHLSSPAFLEDYLQEVGRCGRDEELLKRARLKNLVCTLICHPDDFERNHENVRRSLIEVGTLQKLWKEILDRRVVAEDGAVICVLAPDAPELKNDVPPDKLGRALSWLENPPAKRLEIVGRLPDLLGMRLRRDRLQEAAQGDSDVAVVAAALMKVFEQVPAMQGTSGRAQSPMQQLAETPSLGAETPTGGSGLLGIIRRFVGFVFGAPPAPAANSGDSQQSDTPTQAALGNGVGNEIQAEVNMGEVFRRSGLSSPDAMWRAITQLSRGQSIVIERKLVFNKMEYIGYVEELKTGIKEAVRTLTAKNGKQSINIKDLPEYFPEVHLTLVPGQEAPETRKTTQTVCWAAVHVLRRAGIRVCEMSDDQGQRKLEFNMSDSLRKVVNQRVRTWLDVVAKCVITIRSATAADKIKDAKRVELCALLEAIRENGRLNDLRNALLLLEDLKIWKTEQELIPQSYLLRLLTETPLNDPLPENAILIEEGVAPNAGSDQEIRDQEMFKELAVINRFSELRSFAMELFWLLPDEQSRNRFIDQYFAAADPGSLQSVMEQFLGDIGDTGSSELKAMLAKLRGEAFDEAFDGKPGDNSRPGLSDEQKAVVQARFPEKLLVNAGPGAGKTHVLMMRAAHLIHKQRLNPEQILILAFNRAVVHEIRTRIKDLFAKLGYGSYVRGLRVRTFHAFALEHMGEAVDKADDTALKKVMHRFADRLQNEPAFAHSVVGGTRAILVDEFQDMTSEFYAVVKTLATTAREVNGAGIMVIGDDDQDIMQWARRKADDEITDGAKYFTKFRDELQNVELCYLTTNYRSLKEIVDSSQKMINIECLNISRQKQKVLLNPHRIGTGSKKGLQKSDEWSCGRLIDFIREAQTLNQSCAILCRTNDEVVRLHEVVRHEFPEVVLQGEEGLRLGQLRHIAVFTDSIKDKLAQEGNLFLSDKILDEALALFRSVPIPEAKDEKAIEEIRLIWSCIQKERRGAQLEDFLRFVDEIRTDDFSRIKEKQLELDGQTHFSVVLSTIHKVKGLQFDRVWIHPSEARFPYDRNVVVPVDGPENEKNRVLLPSAIEEAKLYYVAMTRAKDILHYGWGQREKSWFQIKEPEDGSEVNGDCKYLSGCLNEVVLSFGAWNPDRHRYIEREIQKGAFLMVKKDAKDWLVLCHNEIEVATFDGDTGKFVRRLIATKAGIDPKKYDLCVHAVCRYNFDPEAKFAEKVRDEYKTQGWFYVVLVRGVVGCFETQ